MLDDACRGGRGHRIVDLTGPARARLVDEVWGPPSLRRERLRLARAGSGGAAAGGLGELLGSCSGCDGCSALEVGGELGAVIGAIMVVLAVALVAVVVVWLIGKLVAYIQRKRAEPKPQGALLPAQPASLRKWRGVVVGEATRASELSPTSCVGWALELTAKRFLGSGVMLRDGESYGFDVRLDDGRTVRVPEGPLLLARGGAEQDDADLLTAHLRSIDPLWNATDPEPAIPYDRVAAVELRPGDEVELVGPLRLAPDPNAPEHYRGATATVLQAAGIPALRKR